MAVPLFGMICLHIIFSFSLVANLLVIILFYKNKQCSLDQKIFIISLNVCDFLAVLLSYPIFIITQHTAVQGNPTAISACIGMSFLTGWILHTSVIQLCLVAFHRLISVAKPNLSKSIFSKKNCFLMIGAVWIICGVPVTIVVATNSCKLDYIPTKNLCTFNYPKCFGYTIFNITVFTVIPFLFVNVNYILLYYFVKKQRKRVRCAEPGNGTTSTPSTVVSTSVKKKQKKEVRSDSKEFRLLIQLIIITAIFMVCWTPGSTIGRFTGYNEKESLAGYVLGGMIALNSAVNPFVYLLPNPYMRKQLKQFIFCKK